METLELTILMPCLNEAVTLAACINQAQTFLTEHGITGEVLIADNGSDDGSQDIARHAGARVIDAPVLGYGLALTQGITAAQGRYVIMGDCDASYDFSQLMPFVEKLREGYDLIMGNRFKGGVAPGAMPALHQYFGNPLLTFIGRIFFKSPCGDFHCGLRGFNRQSILSLDLHTTGMEFASEMIVKATMQKLKIAEVPTTLAKDGRNRAPHLRSWRDGWRHLRFLLIYSPRWLFLYPGLLLFCVGVTGMILLLPGELYVGDVHFSIHTLVLSGTSTIAGAQILTLAFLAKHYCVLHGLHEPTRSMRVLYRLFSLEHVLLMGLFVFLGGILGVSWSAWLWERQNFGALDYVKMMRLVVPSSVAIIIGLQAMFSAFLGSIISLDIRAKS